MKTASSIASQPTFKTDIDSVRSAYMKSVSVKYNAPSIRVSKNLHIVKSHSQITVVCPITGIVSLMDIPTIPGKTLVYENPLSDLSNARGIVSAGPEYLEKLPTQILAGLFIVLASSYDILRTDSREIQGPHNNAVLRTCGSSMLVKCLVLIENWINSGNRQYIPRVSLTIDSQTKEPEIAARISIWYNDAWTAIKKPDRTKYDENAKPVRIVFDSVQKTSVKRSKEASAKAFARQILKQDKKDAMNILSKMQVSTKMRAFLSTLFSGNNLIEADIMMLKLLINKLEQNPSENASKIITILQKDRSILRTDAFDLEDIDADNTDGLGEAKRATEPVPTEATSVNTIIETSPEESISSEESIAASKINIPEPDYSGLSPIQKIIAKKKWLVATGQIVSQNKPTPYIAEPIKQILTPEYKPSTDKLAASRDEILANADDAPF